MPDELSQRTRMVTDALRAAGATGAVRVLPVSARTAALAAEALGCPVAAIANSLIFIADDAPLLVLTSGAHRVDTAALARRIGKTAITKATAEQVRQATGQAIGGVSPVGHPQPIDTVIDTELAAHEVIWAAAGAPETVFPTSYAELLRITGGAPVEVD